MVIRPVGRPSQGGYFVYELVGKGEPVTVGEANTAKEFVFVNEQGNPYTRYAVACKIKRLRRKAHLPLDAKLYGIRHLFACHALAHKVPLKMVSELLGHANSLITERHYIHTEALAESLQEAAQAGGRLDHSATCASRRTAHAQGHRATRAEPDAEASSQP